MDDDIGSWGYNVRPWGHYEVLYDGSDCKVKRIVVKPTGRLSYQYHFKRTEDWIVVSGMGIITLMDIVSVVRPGERIHIAPKMTHRICNTGNEDLIFIEVQTGTYFGEDDIVRISDDYGRLGQNLKHNL
jgi:mannose-6-phosphate isomerase